MCDLKMSRFSFFTACFLLLGLTAPQSTSAETLQDAVKSVLTSYPTITAAEAAQEVIEQEAQEFRSNYFPDISLGATGGRIYGDNSTSRGLSVTRGAGYSYLWEGNAALTQNIFDGFETESRIESARMRAESGLKNIVDVRERLTAQTAQAYLDIMRTQTALNMIDAHLILLEDYRGRISSMVEEGAADEAERKQAEDTFLIAQTIRNDAEAEFHIAMAQYLQLTGRQPDGSLTMPQLRTDLLPQNLQDALGIAKNHPALIAAKLEAQSGDYDIDAETAAYYPDIDAEMSYLKRDQRDIIGGETIDARAVLSMNWEFATGGAVKARVRQRQQEQRELEALYEDLKRQINLGVHQAWAEYHASAKALNMLGTRLAINQDLVSTYETQFEGGNIRLLQLMQGKNTLFQVKIEHLNATYRRALAEMALLGSIARLQTSLGLSEL